MRLAAHALAAMIVFLGAAACGDDDDDPTNTPEAPAATITPGDASAIEVGAILPLTGTLASYGETSDAALAEAVSAINSGGDTQIDLIIEDSASDPATALEKLRALHERGIRVVIGPYSSSEVAAVIDFANENGMIILSPLSTARSLAIVGDNILRFTPDDEAEGAAVASLAWADGVRTIVAVSRDDPGNGGLRNAVKASFEALGGTVLEGPVYAPDETDFSDEVTEIETAVSTSTAPPEQTGVYLAAFSEVTGLFAVTSQSATLRGVPWYGSDSVALSRELVADATASTFAVETGYPNPILGLRAEDEPLWGDLNDALAQQLGRSVDSFAFAAYDALVTAHAALIATGPEAEATQVREAIVAAAEADGLTGPLTLNEAGDRALAVYDFWAVCAGADEFVWVKAAIASEGEAQRVNPPPTCE